MNKKIALYAKLPFLLIAIAITSMHAAEKDKPFFLPPVVTCTTYGNNNKIDVQSEDLSTPVYINYSTKRYCCGTPHISFETVPIGSSNRYWTCQVQKESHDASKIIFYGNFTEKEQVAVVVHNEDKIKISKIEKNQILITRQSNLVGRENPVEVARFTLKK